MTDKDQKQIYRKIKSRNISIDHACEVGVYLPQTSNIIDFVKSGVRASLVEADPATVNILEEYFKSYNVSIYPVAVWSSSGTVRLSRAAASTFISELESSPAIVNDKYTIDIDNSFEVKCVLFSEIDKGDIDLLSLDIEGGEWHVINHLKSRPKVISIETHGKYYTNPFIENINEWMRVNQYSLWFKDASDSVFLKDEVGKATVADRWQTRLAEAKIKWKKFKRIFKSK